MKDKKEYKFIFIIFLLLIIFLSGCGGGGKNKKPNAPDIVTIDSRTNLTTTVIRRECDIRKNEWNDIESTGEIKCNDVKFSKSQCTIKDTYLRFMTIYYTIYCEKSELTRTVLIPISELNETCQSQGGINCQGCCKSPISSSNILTCCNATSCIERIQFETIIEGLGNVTIERFTAGNYGVWYGEKDKDFGIRKYVDAELIADNTYRFTINRIEYQFTITNLGCDVSINQHILINSINETLNTTENFGSLFVESEPSNASFYVDGVFKGFTPILVTELIPKTYEFKLSKSGYMNSSAFWTINNGSMLNLSINLKPYGVSNETNQTFFNQTQPINSSFINQSNQTVNIT